MSGLTPANRLLKGEPSWLPFFIAPSSSTMRFHAIALGVGDHTFRASFVDMTARDIGLEAPRYPTIRRLEKPGFDGRIPAFRLCRTTGNGIRPS